MTNHLELMYVVYLAVAAFTIVRQCYELKTNSIVQTLLINYIAQLVCNTGLAAVVEDRSIL